MSASSAVLKIDDLTVAYRHGERLLEALRHISLEIPPGQTCGLVGESGSGKTTLALTIMRYLPPEGTVRQGAIFCRGRDLLKLSPREMRQVWGTHMALVPQDPLSSLNPSLRIGEQMAELIRYQQNLSRATAANKVRGLLDMVQLGDPRRVMGSYPHQISGGMLQRVMIAMALSTQPPLLVLDEPTSSLDATTEAAVLDLLRQLIKGRQGSSIYISHNLGVVSQISDRVMVLYAGEVLEDASTMDLYHQPLHPYTQGLLDCVPRLGERKHRVRLRPIRGRIPPLNSLPTGCIFRPRCPVVIEKCYQHPPLYEAGRSRWSRCHRWEEISLGQINAHQPPPEEMHGVSEEETQEVVLRAEDVSVRYGRSRSLVQVLSRRSSPAVRAVNAVSLSIRRGKTLGLVGESGSGKTSLARAIVGLVERTGGKIELLDVPLPPGLKGRSREEHRVLQIVFQNPEEALNPYVTVGEALRRPMLRLMTMPAGKTQESVAELLDAVSLPPEYARRLPAQLSGGERQRVAIARAFASHPSLLVADEPVSALDVSVQASILTLLDKLQATRGASTLFISHDLAVVGYLADEIAVIYLGQLMEIGPAEAVFDPPYHPYTEALLSSVPLIDPEAQQMKIRLEGGLPSHTTEIKGCPFYTRCPRFLGPICEHVTPPWYEDKTGKRSFCHIPLDELAKVQRRAFRFHGRGAAEG